MVKIETKIARSFRLAKADIIRLQNNVYNLSQSHDRAMKAIGELREKLTDLNQQLRELRAMRNANGKGFVAAEKGKSFHVPTCPFARNIKPSKRLYFANKAQAVKKGYKPCTCVKSRR